MKQSRAMLIITLALVVIASAVTVAVCSANTATFDEASLLLIHNNVPASLAVFFTAVSLGGSSKILFPLTTVIALACLWKRHYYEALLLVVSMVSGAALTHNMKHMVSRARPALWVTDGYPGFSFPSSHALLAATFAAAVALCFIHIKPALRTRVIRVAVTWTLLVALSRLVLGAHWPTDVLAGVCFGAAVPLVLRLVFDVAIKIAQRWRRS